MAKDLHFNISKIFMEGMLWISVKSYGLLAKIKQNFITFRSFSYLDNTQTDLNSRVGPDIR